MKKYTWLTILTVLVLTFGSVFTAQAMIIPPQGEGQIGIQAVVMLNELPVYETPDTSSKVVEILQSGSLIILMKQENGWAECCLSDDVNAAPAGWVNTEDLLIDPAWYMTNEETPVYAWNDTEAPVFEVFEDTTLLPILNNDGEWLVVSLNGASAWIHKTEADLASEAN
ncbi:MAG: hypothetical protein J5859_00575 [Clostridia bacterium]|nr:hypothetical protein [Clostridia bacterium]